MVPVYRAGGSGSIPGRTNTQGFIIIEEKVHAAFALTTANGSKDFRVFSEKDVKP